MLVRWAGQDASGESWEPLENLTNCEEAIAAFERSRGVKLPRRPPAPPSAVVGGVPPPLPPTGYTVDPAPGDLGRALVGRRILYWWGEDGWQLGSVARVSSQASFSHVVAYHRRSSALSGTAHSLLDSASYGATWVALSPLPPAGVSRTRASARPPSPPAPTLSLAGGP